MTNFKKLLFKNALNASALSWQRRDINRAAFPQEKGSTEREQQPKNVHIKAFYSLKIHIISKWTLSNMCLFYLSHHPSKDSNAHHSARPSRLSKCNKGWEVCLLVHTVNLTGLKIAIVTDIFTEVKIHVHDKLLYLLRSMKLWGSLYSKKRTFFKWGPIAVSHNTNSLIWPPQKEGEKKENISPYGTFHDLSSKYTQSLYSNHLSLHAQNL